MLSPNQTAKEYLDAGARWRDRVARLALPILLWTAKQSRTITYKQLADELRLRHDEQVMRWYSLYGQPIGKIGYAIEALSSELRQNIPPLNAIVVNAGTDLPGSGVNEFIDRYVRRRRLSKRDRDSHAEQMIERVGTHLGWDAVATALDAHPLTPVRVLQMTEDGSEPIDVPPPSCIGYPESKQHKNLKHWASKNPKFFEDFGKFRKVRGRVEVVLSSGDSLDAHFSNKETRLAIEVKASNAPETELYRGVFQCVKYRATLRAMQLAASEAPNAQAALVTTRDVPAGVLRLAQRLRVTILIAPRVAEISSARQANRRAQ